LCEGSAEKSARHRYEPILATGSHKREFAIHGCIFAAHQAEGGIVNPPKPIDNRATTRAIGSKTGDSD
jgi:hypothetical protein